MDIFLFGILLLLLSALSGRLREIVAHFQERPKTPTPTYEERVEALVASFESGILCYSCLARNAPDVHFCTECGCPISFLSTIGPLERIYAQGWAYRQSVSGRIKPSAFWGYWLLFCPGALCASGQIWSMASEAISTGSGVWTLLGLAGLLPLYAIYVLFLYRLTKNYLKYRRDERLDEC